MQAVALQARQVFSGHPFEYVVPGGDRTLVDLVLEEPDRVATTFAVLALLAVIVASGSFLGLLVEVRRNLH